MNGVPSMRDLARRLGWRNLVDGTVPVAVFVALDHFTGMRWAVVGTTVVSVVVALLRRGAVAGRLR